MKGNKKDEDTNSRGKDMYESLGKFKVQCWNFRKKCHINKDSKSNNMGDSSYRFSNNE